MEQIFESDRIRYVRVSPLLIGDYLVMVNDMEHVRRYFDGDLRPYTEEDERRWVRDKLAEGACVFSMLEKETGEFIGNIELMGPTAAEGELGVALTARKQDRGLGTEAVGAMVRYGTERMGLRRIFLRTDPGNARAIHVYEKCGFREYDRRDGRVFMELLRPRPPLDITIKMPETAEELRGKAYVHWRGWHDAYPGLVSQAYLDRLTLEKCRQLALDRPECVLIAKDGGRVVGFVGFGDRGEEAPDTGEIFALYVLREYYGTGLGRRLMEAGLEQLRRFPSVCLWVLRENARAVRFYRKCGFVPDGAELVSPRVGAAEIRMVRQNTVPIE